MSGAKGITRRTQHVTSGAYSKEPGSVLLHWEKYNKATAEHAREIIQKYLRLLHWDEKHPKYGEIRSIAVLTISRGMLLMRVLDKNYERKVKEPHTQAVIRMRACDELTRLQELDADIQARIAKLGILFNNNKQRRP